MTTTLENTPELLTALRTHAGVGMAVGIVLIILGFLSVAAPFVAGLSVAVMVGLLIAMSGFSRLFLAFKMGSFGVGLIMFVLGLLSIVIGIYMVARPSMALATLTLVLASYFVVDGVFEILYALKLRPMQGWGWQLFSGISALVLGVLIWQQFPLSGLWAIGTLAGIHLLFAGTSIFSVCSAARAAATP